MKRPNVENHLKKERQMKTYFKNMIANFLLVSLIIPHYAVAQPDHTSGQLKDRICSGDIRSDADLEVAIKICDEETINRVYIQVQQLTANFTSLQSQVDKYDAQLKSNVNETAAFIVAVPAVLAVGLLPGVGMIEYSKILGQRGFVKASNFLSIAGIITSLVGIGLGFKMIMGAADAHDKQIEKDKLVQMTYEQAMDLKVKIVPLKKELDRRKTFFKSLIDLRK
jgi:hypothetical protein